MDIAEATQQDIVQSIGGGVVTARRLTMRDIGQLATLKQQAEAGMLHVQIQGLVDAGVKQDQLPAVIRELTKAPSYADVIRWSFTTEGAMAVLEVAGVDAGDRIDAQEFHFLALDCMGIEYEREEAGESECAIPFSNNSQGAAT